QRLSNRPCAVVPPNVTVAPAWNPVPTICVRVSPPADPTFGEMTAMVGGPAATVGGAAVAVCVPADGAVGDSAAQAAVHATSARRMFLTVRAAECFTIGFSRLVMFIAA